MDKITLEKKLKELRLKQSIIDKSWKKAGNRTLLEFFVEIMPTIIKAERLSIFVHDPVDSNLWVQCGTDVKERQIEVPKSTSIVGRVVETGKPVFENDMQNQMGEHDTIAIKTGYVTYNTLCVPVHGVTTQEVTGAIQAVNKIGLTEFTQDDLAILEKLAFNIQIYIENIYLRQEMAKISTQLSEKIVILEKKLAANPGAA